MERGFLVIILNLAFGHETLLFLRKTELIERNVNIHLLAEMFSISTYLQDDSRSAQRCLHSQPISPSLTEMSPVTAGATYWMGSLKEPG